MAKKELNKLQQRVETGMVAVARNSINTDCGPIKNISDSTGTKRGLLYAVGIGHYYRNEIMPVPVCKTSEDYYSALNGIYEDMIADIMAMVREIGTESSDETSSVSFSRETTKPVVNIHGEANCVEIHKVSVSKYGTITLHRKDDNVGTEVKLSDIWAVWAIHHRLMLIYGDMLDKQFRGK